MPIFHFTEMMEKRGFSLAKGQNVLCIVHQALVGKREVESGSYIPSEQTCTARSCFFPEEGLERGERNTHWTGPRSPLPRLDRIAGNTPPTDLLQHIPQDASRADVLSLGCSDLRDLLYSVLLHGRRRGPGRGPVPRRLSFVLNDWEPAIHARSLMLLQMILDSRSLLEAEPKGADGIARGVGSMDIGGGTGGGSSEESKEPGSKKKNARKKASAKAGLPGAAFAQRVGVIFSAMYNMFVDAEVLEMIYDVAGRLAASATSPEKWASTELGRLVRFADDRSQNRIR